MSIYAILTSKTHNSHYLKRYVSFIESCKQVNENYTGYTEKHHICPRSLFPDYKSFTKNPWNLAVLTARQHFIAHWILWKAYPDKKSMAYAFWNFHCTRDMKPSSRTYAKLREEVSIKSHLRGGEIQRKTNKKRVEEGTHHLLDGEISRKIQRKRVEEGTHHFLDKEAAKERNRKRVENGTHHLLSGEIQKETQKKRVDEGTHIFLRLSKERVEDGTHNFLGIVNCVDQNGNDVMINREEYKKQQIGKQQTWLYVHRNSKEGHRRKGIEFISYRKARND